MPKLSTLNDVQKPTVSKTFHPVLEALRRTVVPKYLCTGHMTCVEAVTHNTNFSL